MTQDANHQRTPTEADMLEAVRKSGYFMDQEIATVLEDLGFHVQTSWPFEDPDKGESRELDVWAIRRIIDEESPQLFVELFCECKSGEDRPFVFLSRRKGLIDQNVCPTHFIFPHDVYEKPVAKGRQVMKPFAYFDLGQHHYWFLDEQKAVQFAKIVWNKNRWEAQHDGLYNAILMPLAKALIHRTTTVTQHNSMHLCFPIVVLKSPIYLIDSAKKPLNAEKVNHVSFFRRLDASSVKGDYIVDFVSIDGLTALVNEIIMHFVEHVASEVKKAPNKFLLKHPEMKR